MSPVLTSVKLRPRPTPARFPLFGLSASILSITKEVTHSALSYAILVNNGFERWLVHRRYSEFYAFRRAFLRMTSQCSCRCQYLWLTVSSMVFPRKQANFLPWVPAERIAMDRQDQLNQFLNVVLCLLQHKEHLIACEYARCPVLALVKEFFCAVPATKEVHVVRDLPPKVPRRLPSHDLPIYTIREDDEVINCRSDVQTTWI
ncbi:hypothetical protein ACHHYP_10065 [Achlya hypogyna]|uniref:PX domain-containing protein n=1 Tax=Achlya hypogyna TaxID=1202772 RepID=A0A1V9ZID6_ACHHY|nr:hypothetical protein ACHHYP_10065 [Achlya hypogyna]